MRARRLAVVVVRTQQRAMDGAAADAAATVANATESQ